MENALVIQVNGFWSDYKEVVREIIKEEISKMQPQQKIPEDVIVISDVMSILQKSKQTIFNYIDDGRLTAYKLVDGNKVDDVSKLDKKEKDSLYFFRSEVYKGLRKKEIKINSNMV